MERVDTGILVLSHPSEGNSHPAEADHSPLSSSSLRGNNIPDPRRDSALALWCLNLTAKCRVTRLITEGDSQREYILGKCGAE